MVALIAQLALFAYIRWLIARPLLAASRLLSDLADGKLDADIPDSHRKDEIGDVLRAIAILRRNSQEKRALEHERQRLIDELTEMSRIDFLTGITNRRAFTQAAHAEIARAGLARESATLILFDIDHFKQVNDLYGHDCGDAVLVHVAAIVERVCREGDLAGRYGGEEFVVLACYRGRRTARRWPNGCAPPSRNRRACCRPARSWRSPPVSASPRWAKPLPRLSGCCRPPTARCTRRSGWGGTG
ncbi:Stalked cell differentiation-controlling protein [Chromobacterium violaceum]|uniref:diguanylate cyclase n=1 Tax=Chromobacterium violaceum TaxID=536 RepID=A0A447THL6_CHRVL|nr:Stalked cell differentiation-controlling protein [Chromobacterium violaceum]